MTENSAKATLINLLHGVQEFNANVYPENKELFSDLANQQSPKTLFIACADSRVNPAMITHTEPGDLFVLRNIGNIVPAYGEMLGGVSSAIEYAVMALGVETIVVCGHSDCGAMKALLSEDQSKLDTMPTVKSWLRNAEAAKVVVKALGISDVGPESVRSIAEHNVLLQIQHLHTHPAVAQAVARKALMIQGWFYDIATGEVAVLNEEERRSMSVEQALSQLQAAA